MTETLDSTPLPHGKHHKGGGRHRRPETPEEAEQRKLVGNETVEFISSLPPVLVKDIAQKGLADYIKERYSEHPPLSTSPLKESSEPYKPRRRKSL